MQKNPTALITGASSGIGLELARLHAEAGGNLVIVARNESRLHALRDELEEKDQISVTVLAMDLTSPSAPRELHEAVRADGLEIDYLINNAGFGGQGKFHERDWDEDRAMIQLNIVTLTELCRLFLPDFVARDRGRILNVSSTASLPPGGPLQAVYFATKSYVTAFSLGIAGELQDTDVTVTTLLPAATDTGFASSAGMAKAKLFQNAASARSVAEDGYQGMLAGKRKVVSGLNPMMKAMMLALPFVPEKLALNQIRKMQELPAQ